MTVAYFLVPRAGTGTSEDPYHGKYTIREDYADGSTWQRGTSIYLLPDQVCARIDAGLVDMTEILNDPDCILIGASEDLDQVITPAQEAAADALLEARGMPGNIVQAGQTRRQALRRLVGISRLSVILENDFGAGWRQRFSQLGLTLNSTWADLPQGAKNELLSVAADNGWSAQDLGLSGSSTIREILVAFGNAWTDFGRPFA